MDFFEHQDAARKRTGRLVALFALAVLAIIALTYAVIAGAIVLGQDYNAARQYGQQAAPSRDFWDPMLLLYVGAGTVAVVGLSSLYKISQLSGGGHVVAESLGGKLLHPDTRDLDERKVLNVVEEMAIASGTPVPQVYLLEEPGINAFAAGYSPDDAVVGVTRGAITLLSRDQLQGVIAHEFSHILNGDMRLNIRLMGWVFGILVIGLVGQMLFRAAIYSGHGRVRRSGKDSNPLPLIAIGLALVVVGYVGVFFGSLIKAAVSRQREFLADAAAVQFTRNPDGIAGALKAIGGWTEGSRLQAPSAQEASHMFFSQALSSWLGGALATHPPLAVRIKRIDPSFEGRFPKVQRPTQGATGGSPASAAFAGQGGLTGASGGLSASASGASDLAGGMAFIGAPTAAHIDYARRVLDSISPTLKHSAGDPMGAQGVVFALLIDRDEKLQARQFDLLAQAADPAVVTLTRKLLGPVRSLNIAARLPLIDLALPSLRGMSEPQHRVFRENVARLIRADERITLFEWMLEHILTRHVTTHFEKPQRRIAHYYAIKPVIGQASLLLSVLAYAGAGDEQSARKAFDLAAGHLKSDPPPRLVARGEAKLDALDRALDELDRLAPREKKRLLEACTLCIAADRQVTPAEAELFRALSDALSCPMPPILAGFGG